MVLEPSFLINFQPPFHPSWMDGCVTSPPNVIFLFSSSSSSQAPTIKIEEPQTRSFRQGAPPQHDTISNFSPEPPPPNKETFVPPGKPPGVRRRGTWPEISGPIHRPPFFRDHANGIALGNQVSFPQTYRLSTLLGMPTWRRIFRTGQSGTG